MAFLALNWKWLLPTVGAAVLAVLLGIKTLEIADLKTAAAKTALRIEEQKTEAANTLASETAKVLAKERQIADLTAQLEKDRADAAVKDAAAAADLSDAMRVWQRAHPGCGSGRDRADGANSGPARPVDAAAERVEVVPVGSSSLISRCTADHDELARYSRECHAFVVTLPKACQP